MDECEIRDVCEKSIADLCQVCVPVAKRDDPLYATGMKLKARWAVHMLERWGACAKLVCGGPMKRKTLLLLVAVCLAVACRQPVSPAQPIPTLTPSAPLPGSMKGYELYSWPVGDTWHFTLITGTNRNKTVEEVKSSEDQLRSDGWVRIHVQGVDAILAVLSRVPAGEWVLWAGPGWASGTLGSGSDITLPPQDIVESIRQQAEQLGLQFHVGQ